MKFSGKVALVTGGSVGIGKATSVQLAENGADLVILGGRGKGVAEKQTSSVSLPCHLTVSSVRHGVLLTQTEHRMNIR